MPALLPGNGEMNEIIKNYKLLSGKYHTLEGKLGERAIHDKRVMLRRIFAMLSVFGISPFRVKNGEATFEIFGKLRDIQVQKLKLDSLGGTNEIHEYLKFLKDSEKKEKEKIRKFCKKKRLVFPEIDSKKLNITKLKAKVKKRLLKVLDKTSSLRKINDRIIHQVRIAFKKFRYTLELLYEIKKTDRANLLTLKPYQDLLGDIQDSEVLVNGIRKFYGKKKTEKSKTVEIIRMTKVVKIKRFIKEKEKFIRNVKTQAMFFYLLIMNFSY